MAWTLVYENDENGDSKRGSKRDLIGWIKKGYPVRVVLSSGKDDDETVLAFNPIIYVKYGEVFAQAEWAAVDWTQPDRDKMIFLNHHSTYMLNVSTSGKASRRILFLPECSPAEPDETQYFRVSWSIDV